MRRILIPISIVLLACQTITQFQLVETATFTDTANAPKEIVSTSPTAPLSTPLPLSKPIVSTPVTVRIHPDDGLYVGDLVSFEVEAPAGFENGEIEIQLNPPNGPIFDSQPFVSFGLNSQAQASFYWVWDTSGQDAGDYILAFRVLNNGPSWEQTITLFPEDALPDYALDASWESTANQCCIIYYLSSTSSERDLQAILAQVDQQAAHVAETMGSEFYNSPTIVLIPRVIGHGGFTTKEIYISYLDRNYAGSSLGQVLHHELVHIMDRQLGGEFRPTMLAEGNAVYLSGGHFKQEPLFPRAAALLELDWYIPIFTLVDDFYSHQHEIGYLEAGALIEFMVDKWGQEPFEKFYRSMRHTRKGSHASAMDSALRQHFGISLTELDALFFSALEAHPVVPNMKADVQNTVAYYDTVRRYQQLLDTSAYFRTAWFIYIDDLLELNISADYLRHPNTPDNIALEAMFTSSYTYLSSGEYAESELFLTAINSVLNRVDNGHQQSFNAHPLAAEYLAIVNLLIDVGYFPQEINIKGRTARILALTSGPDLVELNLEFVNGVWVIIQS